MYGATLICKISELKVIAHSGIDCYGLSPLDCLQQSTTTHHNMA